jgi:hypothetical protein
MKKLILLLLFCFNLEFCSNWFNKFNQFVEFLLFRGHEEIFNEEYFKSLNRFKDEDSPLDLRKYFNTSCFRYNNQVQKIECNNNNGLSIDSKVPISSKTKEEEKSKNEINSSKNNDEMGWSTITQHPNHEYIKENNMLQSVYIKYEQSSSSSGDSLFNFENTLYPIISSRNKKKFGRNRLVGATYYGGNLFWIG